MHTLPRQPKVSVITVSYQAQANIEETLKSVLNQTYPHLEYIVVDGGSTDGTQELISEYDRWITKWVSERDKGIYDAMNKGLKMTSEDSDYVIFMNCGDRFVQNNTLEQMVKHGSPDCHLYGDYVKDGKRFRQPSRLHSYFLSTNTLCHQSILFRTAIHRKYLYDRLYDIAADYQVLVEMFMDGVPFQKVNEAVCVYEGGGISDIQRKKLFEQREAILGRYPSIKTFYYSKTWLKKWIRGGA